MIFSTILFIYCFIFMCQLKTLSENQKDHHREVMEKLREIKFVILNKNNER